jgi:prepilin-type N-terminal cleavage/methylation domain-containing protein
MLRLRPFGTRVERVDRRDEAGMTLVEIMVASAISLILVTMMTSMVTVFGKAEISTVNSANAASSVRTTLLQFQHDVQSANPLGLLPLATPVTAYSAELPLTIQPSNTVVTWQYNYAATAQCPQGKCLTRQAGAGTPVVELTSLTNGNPAGGGFLPVFSYYDHCAINLVTESGATNASVQGATTVVQITLSVANLNSAPYGSTTRVNIMNQSPGVGQCG